MKCWLAELIVCEAHKCARWSLRDTHTRERARALALSADLLLIVVSRPSLQQEQYFILGAACVLIVAQSLYFAATWFACARARCCNDALTSISPLMLMLRKQQQQQQQVSYRPQNKWLTNAATAEMQSRCRRAPDRRAR